MRITRRALLTSGIKAGLGVALLEFATGRRVTAFTVLARDQSDRFQTAYMLDGEQLLTAAEGGVFSAGVERITFDTIANGKANRLNYSGIDFYRTFTP